MLNQNIIAGQFGTENFAPAAFEADHADIWMLRDAIVRFDFETESFSSGVTARCYRQAISEMPVGTREELYEEVLESVERRETAAKALVPFIVFELHPRIVARAVRDYLANRQCDISDEFAGVQEVVGIMAHDDTANKGAILAGLVSICDRRINAVARIARRLLSTSDVRDFSRVQSGVINASTVEFCLEWLVELSQNYCRYSVADLACALMLMVVHDEHGVVEDAREVNYVGFKKTTFRESKNFESYYAEILPILGYLKKCEGLEFQIAKVIDLWDAHQQKARALRESR